MDCIVYWITHGMAAHTQRLNSGLTVCLCWKKPILSYHQPCLRFITTILLGTASTNYRGLILKEILGN